MRLLSTALAAAIDHGAALNTGGKPISASFDSRYTFGEVAPQKLANLRSRSTFGRMLSEDGLRLLAELKAEPGGKLCIPCITAGLGLDHWEALKRIRELILSGYVICGWYHCSVCRHLTAVAFLRAPSKNSA